MKKCPNQNTALYKTLKKMNPNENEGALYYMYEVVSDLQERGLISDNKFTTNISGTDYYRVNKIINEKSILNKKSPYGKDLKTFQALKKELEDRKIDWIKIKETSNAYLISFTSPNVDFVLDESDQIQFTEEDLKQLTDNELSEQMLKEQEEAEDKERKIAIPEKQNNIKPGVQEVFDSNPELASIGTPQQYSQYLDTIFPDSKVKDIVYHGSNSKIEKFDTSKSKVSDVIYFSKNINEAKYYANKIPNNGIFIVDDYQYTYLRFEDKNYYLKKERKIGEEKLSKQEAIYKYSISEKEYTEAKRKHGYLNPSLIDIKNLYQGIGEDLFFGGSEYFKDNGFDGFITNNDSGSASILAVFDPEQIHVLGTNQDIEGFREFVDNNQGSPSPKFDSKFPNYTQLQLFEKEAIENNDDLDIFCNL